MVTKEIAELQGKKALPAKRKGGLTSTEIVLL